MTKKPPTNNLDNLEASIKALVSTTLADTQASLTDKLGVIDRAIKFEELKLKQVDGGFGAGFKDD